MEQNPEQNGIPATDGHAPSVRPAGERIPAAAEQNAPAPGDTPAAAGHDTAPSDGAADAKPARRRRSRGRGKAADDGSRNGSDAAEPSGVQSETVTDPKTGRKARMAGPRTDEAGRRENGRRTDGMPAPDAAGEGQAAKAPRNPKSDKAPKGGAERTSARKSGDRTEPGRRNASARSVRRDTARTVYDAKRRRQTLREWLRGRFNLDDDAASQEEVIASLTKGVEFRGVNLWVLIFAALVASLGLNTNSVAVIIGAMLISPIMGPIMGIGLSLGINDFDLLKKSLRNFALMFIVAIATATVYFFISPLSTNTSELLARTVPTTYDLLIAFFGGLAGIVAQTRQDRTSTVIPGVAIATALMPPLCTAGFGLATGQPKILLGAFYLFLINSVFIALATYIMVRFLRYEKKVFFDKVRERTVKRTMMLITLVTFIPSVVIGFQMVRVSIFETTAKRYVDNVFRFPHTRVIECKPSCARGGRPSQIELLLVGEPLDESSIENARAQLEHFGLEETELVVRQASRHDEVDVASLQESYTELLEEKNRRIGEMTRQLSRYRMTNVEVDDISRELGAMMPAVETLSLMKGITFDTEGTPGDTTVVCVVRTRSAGDTVDRRTLVGWLRARTKVDNVKLFVE